MKKVLAAVVVIGILIAVLAVFLSDEIGSPSQAVIEAGGDAAASTAEAEAGDDGAGTQTLSTEVAQASDAEQESNAADGGELVADVIAEIEDEAAEVIAAAETTVTEATGEIVDEVMGIVSSGTDTSTVLPSFDVVRVEPDGAAVMAGRAAAGAAVQVLAGDGVLAETTADDNGEWVVVLDTPLAPGSHEIWLEATDGDGSSAESREAVVVSVPLPAASEAAAVTVAESASDGSTGGLATTDDEIVAADTGTEAGTDDTAGSTGESAIVITVPRDGEGEVAILQAPADGVGISGGGALTLDSLTYDENGAVALAGRASPDAEVRAYVDGGLVGRAVADGDGAWHLTLERTLDAGLHELRLDQVDGAGTVTARLTTPIQQAAFTMPVSAEPLVVIQPGNNLWLIARHAYGAGVRYTQIFEANRSQIDDPDLIYPGQIFVLPDVNGLGG